MMKIIAKYISAVLHDRPLLALHHKIQQFVEETTLAAIIRDAKPINLTLEESSYETANLS